MRQNEDVSWTAGFWWEAKYWRCLFCLPMAIVLPVVLSHPDLLGLTTVVLHPVSPSSFPWLKFFKEMLNVFSFNHLQEAIWNPSCTKIQLNNLFFLHASHMYYTSIQKPAPWNLSDRAEQLSHCTQRKLWTPRFCYKRTQTGKRAPQRQHKPWRKAPDGIFNGFGHLLLSSEKLTQSKIFTSSLQTHYNLN